MVARRFFLLIAGFLLFIDDDEAEILEWRKDGRARADDDARFAVADAPPFASRSPSLSAECRTATPSKRAPNQARHCRPTHRVSAISGTRTIAVFSARERFLDGAHVDLGLAATGDAVEEEDAEFTKLEASFDGVEGGFLISVEFVGGGFVAGVERVVGGIDAFFPGFEEARSEHAVDDGAGDAGQLEDMRKRKRAAFDELIADAGSFVVEGSGSFCW